MKKIFIAGPLLDGSEGDPEQNALLYAAAKQSIERLRGGEEIQIFNPAEDLSMDIDLFSQAAEAAGFGTDKSLNTRRLLLGEMLGCHEVYLMPYDAQDPPAWANKYFTVAGAMEMTIHHLPQPVVPESAGV